MSNFQKTTSRKKFLLWTTATLSSLSALKFLSGTKKKEEKNESNTVRMLTQDGKLVEIDKELVIHSAKKISDKELQDWVKNKPVQ